MDTANLVVEDDHDIARLLALHLRDVGDQVNTVYLLVQRPMQRLAQAIPRLSGEKFTASRYPQERPIKSSLLLPLASLALPGAQAQDLSRSSPFRL